MSPDRSPGSGARNRALRVLGACGAVLAAWVVVDGIRSNPLRDSAAGGSDFLLYWVLPFAVAAVFLGWFAVRGSGPASTRVAKRGCLGGLLLGGGVFALYATSPLILPWDALTGSVHAFLYAPLAAAVGVMIGVASASLGRR